MWNITLLWLFCCPVLVILFFLATLRRSNLWTKFNHLQLKWCVVTQGCAFWGFGWRPTILRVSKPPENPKKGAWLGWQNYKIVISPAGNVGLIPNFDIQPHSWLRGLSRITKFVFKMADNRYIAKYWKRYNSPINGLIWMKRGWSHPIMFPTCPPWCHGNGRCLATVHWTFSSYGRLEVECVNQFCSNLVYNSKVGPQSRSHDQILKFLKFKMADGRHVGKYSKCHNSPTKGPTGTQLAWSHPIMFSACPPCCGYHGNGRCLATAHCTFSSYGRLRLNAWTNFVEI